MVRKLAILVSVVGFSWLLPSSGAYPASLPKATEKMLEKVKLDPSILSGLDHQLQVPQELVERARKEGKVQVRGDPVEPKELSILFGPFKERYPFIDIEYAGGSRQDRTIKTLMAYRAGRLLSDAVINVGAFVEEFKKAGGLEDLRTLPALRDVPKEFKDPAGSWVTLYQHYWCMAYNTKLVQEKDLPKKWEDLFANPAWRNGNLALGNRPNLWALNLWIDRGESWTKDFLARLFTEGKPQLRKEGIGALTQLVAAGEFRGAIPSYPATVYQMSLTGAPLGFTCPEPVPVSPGGTTIILKGAPNRDAAKMLVNWLLSKEGQVSLHAASSLLPMRPELKRKEFLPFADHILGKKEAFLDPNLEEKIMPQLLEYWNDLWLKGGRPSR